ncbi:MAG: hypothetical protein AB7P50_20875 [Alphaproteobacteria bacterium]
MKFRGLLLAGAASAALIGTAQLQSAGAETLPMIPQTGVVALSDFFYMSIGGTAQVVELPKFNYGRHYNFLANTYTDVYADRNRVITGGPAITIGYNLPWNIGTRPRVEFAAMANFGMVRDQVDSIAAPMTRAFFPTDLDTGAPLVGTFADAQRIDLRIIHENADGTVRVKTDIPIGGMFTLSPSVGAVFGWTQTRYDVTSRALWTAAAADYNNVLKESLTTWRGGAEIGFDATLSLGQNFKLHGGMTGAAFYQHSHIKASECRGISFPPGVQPACSLPVPPQPRPANVADENYGVRAGASLGATVSTGWMNITFMGTGSYNINMPQIENPRFLEQPQKGVKVGWEDRFSYGGYIMATFPLN